MVIKNFILRTFGGKEIKISPEEPVDFDWILIECENRDEDIESIIIPLRALRHGSKKEVNSDGVLDRGRQNRHSLGL